MDHSYKIDEGYSEEPMRTESSMDDGPGLDDLRDGFMALNEVERMGRYDLVLRSSATEPC